MPRDILSQIAKNSTYATGGLFGNRGSKLKYNRKPPSQSQKDKILDRQGYKCAKCGKKFGAAVHPNFDHKIRVSDGGATTTKNMQALCPTCHDNKTRKERVRAQDKTKGSRYTNNRNPFDVIRPF